ncbi:putative phosphoesterase [Defluviimonas denitrificans]|jgi:DNA ligase-associated metallophosphoesterase|uniref:Putative phosphoesterase n=1 Tax=Albidovulum denitrificans TaxID=404881 RepID=A0A2S8S956_9RHOB|nr:ligase-associated DNA damage response endonuclease PdeM [Defluviimonas denitrificans]PQV57361.1 putative phosphoesterase [Defluviimonas denitrificans]
MSAYDFRLCETALTALPSGALYWAEQGVLVVSDLHLGKSERIARRSGVLLPPYEVTETLSRLDADIATTAPRLVICLGDSFDDLKAADLAEDHALWLTRLMAGRRWVWIEGNHDPGPVDLGGEHRTELTLGPLTFRHIALLGATGEVSGHYHPKMRVAGQSRRCFLLDGARLILPAFGTYTGGLSSDSIAFSGLMEEGAIAILTGRKALPVPIPKDTP